MNRRSAYLDRARMQFLFSGCWGKAYHRFSRTATEKLEHFRIAKIQQTLNESRMSTVDVPCLEDSMSSFSAHASN